MRKGCRTMGHEHRRAAFVGTLELEEGDEHDVAYCRECADSMYEQYLPNPMFWLARPFLIGVRRSPRFGLTIDITQRFSYVSRLGTTRMRWGACLGSDENCNRTVLITLWPIGHIVLGIQPHWRQEPCLDCQYIDMLDAGAAPHGG